MRFYLASINFELSSGHPVRDNDPGPSPGRHGGAHRLLHVRGGRVPQDQHGCLRPGRLPRSQDCRVGRGVCQRAKQPLLGNCQATLEIIVGRT